MKKYQLWLESKNYSQHLNNLMRIKMVSTQRKSWTRWNAHPEKKISKDYSSNQSLLKLNNGTSQPDLCYLLSARQLQKHKLRLVRSNEIVRQNEQMVKRLNKAKHVISNKRPVDYTNFKLKRQMERTNLTRSSQIKEKKYQKFLKIHSQKVSDNNKYQLTLTIQDIDHRLVKGSHIEIGIQILAPKNIASSNFIDPKIIKNQPFQFAFPSPLPDDFKIQVNCYKGLEHIIIGKYSVTKPPQGETVREEWPAVGEFGAMKGALTYRRILPKIWSIDRFKL